MNRKPPLQNLRFKWWEHVTNRKAYYDDIAFLQLDPARNQQPLGVLLADINGLKAANDKDGHESGDRLIVSIARVLKSVFTGADMYRLGGDEFVVLSYDESEKDFRDKLDLLDMHWKEGMSAATGSVWLEDARNLEQQVAIADRSMRQDKRQYYEIEQHNRRRDRQMAPEELLRKVDEVSEYLPGGFFIYKADESERIISFNREVVKLFECETEEEFHLLTRNSFRGMVHPDDIDRVHSEIKAQIRKENDIDYVEYRILCKDGTEKLVRDYGRFIHTNAYGDVYYVFVNDITQR